MSLTAAPYVSQTVLLTPAECHAIKSTLQSQPTDDHVTLLIDKLDDAETLAVWLRDEVRLELTPEEAGLLLPMRTALRTQRAVSERYAYVA